MDQLILPRPRKLNVGCGYDRREGYINVDMNPIVRPEVVANLVDMWQVPAGAFEEVYAQDCLEHVLWREVPRALYEWNRVLEMGGRMFVRVPSILHLAKKFAEPERQAIKDQKDLICCLFSQQLLPGDYHLVAFTERLLRFYLWETGFEITDIFMRDDWMYELWATKVKDFYRHPDLMAPIDDEEFIRRCYRLFLNREGEPEGMVGNLNRMREGTSRDGMVKNFLLSEERENTMGATCPEFPTTLDDVPWRTKG